MMFTFGFVSGVLATVITVLYLFYQWDKKPWTYNGSGGE